MTLTKEEVLRAKTKGILDLNDTQKKAVLSAIDYYSNQTNANCIELLNRAKHLVGNPATNLSAGTDLACDKWHSDYAKFVKK